MRRFNDEALFDLFWIREVEQLEEKYKENQREIFLRVYFSKSTEEECLDSVVSPHFKDFIQVVDKEI